MGSFCQCNYVKQAGKQIPEILFSKYFKSLDFFWYNFRMRLWRLFLNNFYVFNGENCTLDVPEDSEPVYTNVTASHMLMLEMSDVHPAPLHLSVMVVLLPLKE